MSSHINILDEVATSIRALQRIGALAAHPHMKGYEFEKDFVRQCIERGLDATRVKSGGHTDILVGGKRVQCKCLTPSTDGSVWIQPGSGSNYRPGDFDVLAMLSQGITYIIPASELLMTGDHIRSKVKPSVYSDWADAWEVFDGSDFVRRRQFIFGFADGDSKEGEATDGR